MKEKKGKEVVFIFALLLIVGFLLIYRGLNITQVTYISIADVVFGVFLLVLAYLLKNLNKTGYIIAIILFFAMVLLDISRVVRDLQAVYELLIHLGLLFYLISKERHFK